MNDATIKAAMRAIIETSIVPITGIDNVAAPPKRITNKKAAKALNFQTFLNLFT
jgi:hypothetical protein